MMRQPKTMPSAKTSSTAIIYDHMGPRRFAQLRAKVEMLLCRASHEVVEDHP